MLWCPTSLRAQCQSQHQGTQAAHARRHRGSLLEEEASRDGTGCSRRRRGSAAGQWRTGAEIVICGAQKIEILTSEEGGRGRGRGSPTQYGRPSQLLPPIYGRSTCSWPCNRIQHVPTGEIEQHGCIYIYRVYIYIYIYIMCQVQT